MQGIFSSRSGSGRGEEAMNARNEYLENSVRGASPLGLVVKLYEQIVEDLRRAMAAIDANQIDKRTNAINHAILILEQLQGRLDHAAGGEVADNLDRFYNVIRDRLLQAHILQSKAQISEVMSAVLEVRNAWQQAERAYTAPPNTPANAKEVAAPVNLTAARLDWKI